METKTALKKKRKKERHRSSVLAKQKRVANEIKGWAREVCCSESWMDECTHRGTKYLPNFKCHCKLCTERFPRRLHPAEARESMISGDCQIESEVTAKSSLQQEIMEMFAEEQDRHGHRRIGCVIDGLESDGDHKAENSQWWPMGPNSRYTKRAVVPKPIPPDDFHIG